MQTNKERLIAALQEPLESTFANYKTSALGLVDDQVEENRDAYGENVITKGQEDSMIKKIYESIINPFTVILLVIALVSFITNVWLAKPGEQDPTTSIIIVTLVLISGGIRFIQELRSDKAASNLSRMIVNTATVLRDGSEQEIPIDEIVVGDVIKLSAGDMIPADVVLIDSRDFFVQQSGLTGESDAVEKICLSKAESQNLDSLLASESLAFMGTNVISGRATALVLVVGDETMMGAIEQTINTYDEPTSFEREMNTISWLLIRLMLVMVPVVFVINGLTDGDWLEAGVFALSVGVGLTPEMLPMIITASLAKGSIIMAKEKVVIKKLNAIQDLGAIDILCTDKTGTLTQDEIVLEYPLDIHGELDLSVLRRAYLNSYFQTGLKNLMDRAIINRTQKEAKKHEIVRDLDQTFHKIDELPFDFERRRMSVIVKDEDGVVSMVTKGALEEMLSVSTYVEYKGEIKRLTDEVRQEVLAEVAQLNEQGLRVLGVSYKTDLDENDIFSVEDERDMILTGYLAFLDPPKPSAAPAIKALAEYGVTTKILTGDNEKVTQAVCEKVGLDVERILLGSEIDTMTDQELAEVVETTTVFAKLSPDQKARIILCLKNNGHKVGYMGDGINDAPSMKVSDVGISVDTAVDIAKETADVILLDKDLMVLEKGLVEGRKVYANMTKYIKMTVSSNFGNIFSLLFASIFLPFLPMAPVHLIVLNLIYDLSCIALPFDNVDKEFLKKPRIWEANSIMRFMAWIGPISSVFDIITYMLLYFLVVPMILGHGYNHGATDAAAFIMVFQTGWFIESMWSQTMVIHMLRSPKLPFIQSRPAFSVVVTTLAAAFFVTSLPYSPLASILKLSQLNGLYFVLLFAIIVLYMLSVTVVKRIYIKKYKEWL
ncbi:MULTISPECIES: magnesium-translocating P-type ATPase [Streptococcus]|uniref:Magnesium-transporting ATPase, P-type 1 n=3 Tax=Streptococcus TaxID=1301 RepID=V8BDJ4_STRPA|nr:MULTISPECIES: magnesium-translocating P-type ATPase [Streptococcus]MBZ1355308.1 magnesium-translocating P-type ATPase [Streptococcus sp. LPB0406]ETD12857.1 magnesium-translocating P-type ATPase [Streptococcus parasanguinis CC87K]MBS6718225.1 magnesium-translocating P-type ATPase [Streptococcus parasanguinis]MTR40368.1 magnesium-translocating P-type ATPase [Streptococcus parasanguinis]OFP07076.1 magnesium-translocating P-type ATPase [Streptococcus sp. HMSC065E03]